MPTSSLTPTFNRNAIDESETIDYDRTAQHGVQNLERKTKSSFEEATAYENSDKDGDTTQIVRSSTPSEEKMGKDSMLEVKDGEPVAPVGPRRHEKDWDVKPARLSNVPNITSKQLPIRASAMIGQSQLLLDDKPYNKSSSSLWSSSSSSSSLVVDWNETSGDRSFVTGQPLQIEDGNQKKSRTKPTSHAGELSYSASYERIRDREPHSLHDKQRSYIPTTVNRDVSPDGWSEKSQTHRRRSMNPTSTSRQFNSPLVSDTSYRQGGVRVQRHEKPLDDVDKQSKQQRSEVDFLQARISRTQDDLQTLLQGEKGSEPPQDESQVKLTALLNQLREDKMQIKKLELSMSRTHHEVRPSTLRRESAPLDLLPRVSYPVHREEVSKNFQQRDAGYESRRMPSPPHSYGKSRSRRTRWTFLEPGELGFAEQFVQAYNTEPFQSVLCCLEMRDVFGPFLTHELEPGDGFWDLVVLVGDPLMDVLRDDHTHSKCVTATSCGEYVKWTWPRSVDRVKNLFEMLDLNTERHSVTDIQQTTRDFGDNVSIKVSRVVSRNEDFGVSQGYDRKLEVHLEGPVRDLPDLVEALTWLYTVLQSGPMTKQPFAAKAYLSGRRGDNGLMSTPWNIKCDVLSDLIVPHFSSCWTTMFPRTACATQFQTHSRPAGIVGVQMSFDLMCLLGGLQYETLEDDGIILFGQNSLAYPVRQIQNCVQWHFEYYDPTKPPNNFTQENRLRVSDLDSLREGTLHFVGLWEGAHITLGCGEMNSPRVGWSGLREVKKEVYKDGYTFGGTIQAPKVLQANWTQQYKIARSRRNQYMVDFEANLDRMIGTPVLLYSPGERRAWIVSYVSVLLHIARERAAVQKNLGFSIPGCSLSGDGGKAAFECLQKHHKRPLKQPAQNEQLSDEEQKYTIRHYVDEVQAAMEVVRRESCRAKGPMSVFKQRIIGFEMADFVFMKPILRMKQQKLDTVVGGGWAPLLDDIQYTFFYEGLSDPILPNGAIDVTSLCECDTWRTVPTGHNLLTVSLPTLTSMTEDKNRTTLDRITFDHRWHVPDQLFQSCGKTKKHLCSRLQELKASDDAIRPELTVNKAKFDGAVVFRYKDDIKTIVKARNKPPKLTLSPSSESDESTDSVHDLHSQTRRKETLDVPSSRQRHGSDSGYSTSSTPRLPPPGVDQSPLASSGFPSEPKESDKLDASMQNTTSAEERTARDQQKRRHKRRRSGQGNTRADYVNNANDPNSEQLSDREARNEGRETKRAERRKQRANQYDDAKKPGTPYPSTKDQTGGYENNRTRPSQTEQAPRKYSDDMKSNRSSWRRLVDFLDGK